MLLLLENLKKIDFSVSLHQVKITDSIVMLVPGHVIFTNNPVNMTTYEYNTQTWTSSINPVKTSLRCYGLKSTVLECHWIGQHHHLSIIYVHTHCSIREYCGSMVNLKLPSNTIRLAGAVSSGCSKLKHYRYEKNTTTWLDNHLSKRLMKNNIFK